VSKSDSLHFQWLQKVSVGDAAKKINELHGSKMLTRQTAYNWYARFVKEGIQLKDKERKGRPQKIDRKAVVRYIKENPTSTTRMIAEDFDCKHSKIVRILQSRGMIVIFVALSMPYF
jgi:transposase